MSTSAPPMSTVSKGRLELPALGASTVKTDMPACMNKLGITMDMLTRVDLSPCWWQCDHGLVSTRNRYCRFGCDAHVRELVTMARGLFRDAILAPGPQIGRGGGENHAGYSEYTPLGDVQALTTLVATHVVRLDMKNTRSPMWLCRHGFVDCMQSECSRGCRPADWVAVWQPSNSVSIHRGRAVRAVPGIAVRPECTSEELIDMEWVEVLIAMWLGEVELK